MSDGIPYADIVIMALVAGFILLRLRGVLGDKIGNDKPSYFNKPAQTTGDRKETIIQLDDKSLKTKLRQESDPYMLTVKDDGVASAIALIKTKDPEFSATDFLEGAKGAFEMVFDAFSREDKDTLKFLLSTRVYQEFGEALNEAQSVGTKNETTLISVKAHAITSAELVGMMARLTVAISSEQVHVTRNAEGVIVDGDASQIHAIEDEWTFERDVTSKNPNWKVIET